MADDLDAYIDGVMAALPVARKTTPLLDGLVSWWDGSIDSMTVWNRPLTDNEWQGIAGV